MPEAEVQTPHTSPKASPPATWWGKLIPSNLLLLVPTYILLAIVKHSNPDWPVNLQPGCSATSTATIWYNGLFYCRAAPTSRSISRSIFTSLVNKTPRELNFPYWEKQLSLHVESNTQFSGRPPQCHWRSRPDEANRYTSQKAVVQYLCSQSWRSPTPTGNVFGYPKF